MTMVAAQAVVKEMPESLTRSRRWPWASKVAYVRLKMWRMTRACCTYNLIETWRKGVVGNAENALRDGTMLQLCVFRRY
ncbi:hypothetical protein WN943_019841 [Citrus x changshan-huyou]